MRTSHQPCIVLCSARIYLYQCTHYFVPLFEKNSVGEFGIGSCSLAAARAGRKKVWNVEQPLEGEVRPDSQKSLWRAVCAPEERRN